MQINMYIILIFYLFLPLFYVELDTGKTSIWAWREKTCFSYSYVLALHLNAALKLSDLKKKTPKLSVFQYLATSSPHAFRLWASQRPLKDSSPVISSNLNEGQMPGLHFRCVQNAPTMAPPRRALSQCPLCDFLSVTNPGLDRTGLEIPISPLQPDSIYDHLGCNASLRPLNKWIGTAKALLRACYAPVRLCQLLGKKGLLSRKVFVCQQIIKSKS